MFGSQDFKTLVDAVTVSVLMNLIKLLLPKPCLCFVGTMDIESKLSAACISSRKLQEDNFLINNVDILSENYRFILMILLFLCLLDLIFDFPIPMEL